MEAKKKSYFQNLQSNICLLYTIIDIETNGLSKSRGKITEIAIFKHDGQKIIDQYETLINPEGSIPYDISRLTGITDSMVKDAPKFYEVAKQIEEFTQDCVFVAHNVNFDYGFVQQEFKDLGFNFQRKKICTVKQSRLLIPGRESYSLGKLCVELGIENNARHRAAGDARATVTLFEHLLSIDSELGLNREKKEQLSKYLHPQLDLNNILEAPKQTGVYYFHNDKNEVIYVGKSINIRTRLYNHLRQPKTNKAIKMHTQVADVSFALTGSELVALLLESEEIKLHQPIYNTALKKNSFPFGIVTETDLFGYQHLKVEKVNANSSPLALFASQSKAKTKIENLVNDFELCACLCGVQKCGSSCITYQTKICNGAALHEENSEEYNLRIQHALESFSQQLNNALIIEKSSDNDQLWAIHIENGEFRGMGSFDPKFSSAPSQILECIKPYQHNPDNKYIIKSYLSRKKVKQLIDLDNFSFHP